MAISDTALTDVGFSGEWIKIVTGNSDREYYPSFC